MGVVIVLVGLQDKKLEAGMSSVSGHTVTILVDSTNLTGFSVADPTYGPQM